MLSRVAISAELFSENFGQNHYRRHAVHRLLTAQLNRHARIVCRNDHERRRYRRLVNKLPSKIAVYWDPIVSRAGEKYHFLFPSPPLPDHDAMDIRTRGDLIHWKESIDHLLVQSELADEFGFNAASAGEKDPDSGISVSSYQGITPHKIDLFEQRNSRYYRPGEISSCELWNIYFRPLVEAATEIVVVDKFAIHYLESADWLWRKMATTEGYPKNKERTLEILTSCPDKSRDKKSIGDQIKAANSYVEETLAKLDGFRSVRILWVPKDGWKRSIEGTTEKKRKIGRHDRNFRFDTRTLAITSGLEFVADPSCKDSQVTYRCQGDRQSQDFENLEREEGRLRAAAQRYSLRSQL